MAKLTNVIVIGAGAAGLLTAKMLAEKGINVQVLEARDRIGGRIMTLNENDWDYAAEGGAEFIHGKLPLTFKLLKQAGLLKTEVGGRMWQVFNGKWSTSDRFLENEQEITARLKKLDKDISIDEFLEQEFGGPDYEQLRQSVRSYVEGYYAADPRQLSALSFLEEWESEDEEQFRPSAGYAPLLHHFQQIIIENGGSVQLSTVVKKINWQPGSIQVTDQHDNTWYADAAVISVPIGVLTAVEDEPAYINITPDLPVKRKAAAKLGYGTVVKILLRFTENFWQDEKHDIGFVFSDQPVGTWWTQNPRQAPTLTGWIGGPRANDFQYHSDDDLVTLAIQSLARIFSKPEEELYSMLGQARVFNWRNDPFALGAYSYSTIDSAAAIAEMNAPVDNTLFFTGEGLYEGNEMGTVEAALISGQATAKKILAL